MKLGSDGMSGPRSDVKVFAVRLVDVESWRSIQGIQLGKRLGAVQSRLLRELS